MEQLNYKKIMENKKLLLLKEYKNLNDFYISCAKHIERKRIKYASSNIIKNKKTGSIHLIKSDFKSYLNSYFNTIIQRLIYNKKIAEKENLTPFFITFTLPSEYHPFKTYNKKNLDDWELNENFKFNSIEEAVKEGYLQLNLIFRYFYTYLKTQNRKYRKQLKNLRYNVFFEYHKSFLPHLHLLIYLPNDAEIEKWLLQAYNRTIEKFGMNPASNKLIKIEDKQENGKKLKKLDGAVLYISKYISKNLKKLFEIPDNLDDLKDIISNREFNNFKVKERELYKYIGWKSYNNIRIFRGNNMKIGIKNYSKIYYSLEEQEKKELLEQAKNNNSCLLFEIEKLITRYTKIKDTKNKKEKIKKIKIGTKYKINEVKEKIRKTRYVKIYELFKIVILFKQFYSNASWLEFDFVYKYDFVDDDYYNYKLNNLIEKIEEYLHTFDFVFELKLKQYKHDLDLDEDYILVERLLNNELKTKILDDTLQIYERNENIFKQFVKNFINVYNNFIKSKKYIGTVAFKEILQLKPYIINYYKQFKKWIDSDLSFSSLFFTTYYKITNYVIYKNNEELYNKDNYEKFLYCPSF